MVFECKQRRESLHLREGSVGQERSKSVQLRTSVRVGKTCEEPWVRQIHVTSISQIYPINQSFPCSRKDDLLLQLLKYSSSTLLVLLFDSLCFSRHKLSLDSSEQADEGPSGEAGCKAIH